jgi:hypothetical protein
MDPFFRLLLFRSEAHAEREKPLFPMRAIAIRDELGQKSANLTALHRNKRLFSLGA